MESMPLATGLGSEKAKAGWWQEAQAISEFDDSRGSKNRSFPNFAIFFFFFCKFLRKPLKAL